MVLVFQAWTFTPWFFVAFLVIIRRPCRSSQKREEQDISRSWEREDQAVNQGRSDEDDSAALVEVLPWWVAQKIVKDTIRERI